MDNLGDYIQEVMQNTSYIFKSFRRHIKELVIAVLNEGIYIDYVWFSVSHSKEIKIFAIGYDDDGVDVEVTGTWERDTAVVSDAHERQFDLVDVLVEEL